VKRAELQSNLAMMVVLLGLSMFFATLLMGYAIFRTSADSWPPQGMVKLSLLLPSLSTLVIFISGLTCYQTIVNIKQNNLKMANKNLNRTILLGIGFMVLQGFLWANMKSSGVFVYSGIFASVLYGFTWIHAAHVVAGLIALGYLKWNLKPGTQNLLMKAVNVEKFWYFLELIWIIMFITLFVI
jgi:cytochrome c oxidase subunit 3